MEPIIFAILSALLIFGYVHEDWFVQKEDTLLRYAVVLVSLACKKILQTLEKCGKLDQKKQSKHKEVHHARHIKRVQGF